MEKKKIGFFIAVLMLMLSPLICIGIVNNIKITNKNYQKVNTNVVDSYKLNDGYSVRVKYKVDDKYYESRIVMNSDGDKKITLYYNKSNPNDLVLSNKEHLSSTTKMHIYRVFGIAFLIYSIIIAILYRHKIISSEQSQNEKLSSDEQIENIHTFSHQEFKKEDDKFIVVGKIIDVIKEEDSYTIIIEYEYNDDIYDFKVGGFDKRIKKLISDKETMNIDVYIDLEEPENAQIDEKKLRSLLK